MLGLEKYEKEKKIIIKIWSAGKLAVVIPMCGGDGGGGGWLMNRTTGCQTHQHMHIYRVAFFFSFLDFSWMPFAVIDLQLLLFLTKHIDWCLMLIVCFSKLKI